MKERPNRPWCTFNAQKMTKPQGDNKLLRFGLTVWNFVGDFLHTESDKGKTVRRQKWMNGAGQQKIPANHD